MTLMITASPCLVDLRRCDHVHVGGRGERVLELHDPRVGAAVVTTGLGQLLRQLVLELLRLLLLSLRLRGLLLELGALLLELGGLRLELVALGLQLGTLRLQGDRLRLKLVALGAERALLRPQLGGLGIECAGLRLERPRLPREVLRARPQDGNLGARLLLLPAQLGETHLEPPDARRILRPGERSLGAPLGETDRPEPARQALGLGAQPGRLLLELRLLRLERGLLLLELGSLCAERSLLLLELGGLRLERGLLPLERGLLLLQRGLLTFELRLLLLELLLLRLERLLLLLELVLERDGLVVGLRVRGARLGGRIELGRDQERPVVAHAEPGRHQVVGLPLGGGLGRRPDVLLAELEREGGHDQWGQHEQRGRDGEPRMPDDEPRPASPPAFEGRPRPGPEERRDTQRVDPAPDQAEQGGQQADRTEHGGEDRDRGGVPERGHERDPRHHQRDERDHDGGAREHDRRPRGRHGAGDRLPELHARLQLVFVTCDEEEGVVDPDAEPDHRRERRADGGDVEDVAEQADERQGDREPDDRGHDRHAHRDEAAEGEREDDHRRRDADDLAALGLGLRQLGADRAADRHLHARRTTRLGGVEDVLRRLLVQGTGADVEQDGDEGVPPVLADETGRGARERIAGAVDVRLLDDRLVGLLDRLLERGFRDLALRRVEDHRARAVLLRGEPLREQVVRMLAVGSGEREIVRRLGADAVNGEREDGRHGDPGEDDRERMAGAQPSDAMQESRHATTLSWDPGSPDFLADPRQTCYFGSKRARRSGGCDSRRGGAHGRSGLAHADVRGPRPRAAIHRRGRQARRRAAVRG